MIDTEQIVLVDDSGKPTGAARKLASHHANTPLHLAFSCYIFNPHRELLVTRRADSKKVWPGVITNSVCGHPMPEENMEEAIGRRAQYELGINHVSNLKILLSDYRYKTPPFNGIIENEICPVYIALTTDSVILNPNEVSESWWLPWQEYSRWLVERADECSYWAKDQMKHLQLENVEIEKVLDSLNA